MFSTTIQTFLDGRPVWPDFLNNRPAASHKGDYGHALLVAGSYGKMGAAVLAARACLRMGAGLLTVHVPRRGVEILQTAVPEAMVSIDEDECHWTHRFTASELSRYDAVGIGPGLGTESPEALRTLLHQAVGKPAVIDADGLNMLARMDDKADLIHALGSKAPTVLTPHAKEFERLFGKYADAADRQRAQRELSRETNCAIVYKGHRSQITGVEGEMYVNTTGNPGMATAGSGDVLTGMMLSILSQNKDNQLNAAMCAVLGVWMHGKSGDLAAEKQPEYSIVAGDLVNFLCSAMF
jgi:NAD(P)H-hydrate epimerase